LPKVNADVQVSPTAAPDLVPISHTPPAPQRLRRLNCLTAALEVSIEAPRSRISHRPKTLLIANHPSHFRQGHSPIPKAPKLAVLLSHPFASFLVASPSSRPRTKPAQDVHVKIRIWQAPPSPFAAAISRLQVCKMLTSISFASLQTEESTPSPQKAVCSKSNTPSKPSSSVPQPLAWPPQKVLF
jgi:hypothetical protein